MKAPQLSDLAKWVPGLIGALFVGALGSGFWEVALRDPFFWLGRRLLEFVASLMSGYLDSLYAQVGAAYTDSFSILPFVALASVSICTPPFVVLSLHLTFKQLSHRVLRTVTPEDHLTTAELKSKIAKQMKRLRILLYYVLTPIVFATVLMLISLAAKSIYIRQAANWLDRSIDIVAPLVSEEERLVLRSEFRGINTAANFYVLYDKLNAISARNGRELPKFEPIGISTPGRLSGAPMKH